MPLVTICARKGSKRLPGKNFRKMNGKPLMYWTIKQAMLWNGGDIAVSTDSDKVVKIFSELPLDVYKRQGPKIHQDDSNKLDVLRDLLVVVEQQKRAYRTVIDLDVTNPLRTPVDIEIAYKLFISRKCDVLASVVPAQRNPYFNQVESRYAMDKRCLWCLPAGNGKGISRTQDAPSVYDLNCCIYIYKRDWLLNPQNRHPVTQNFETYQMPEWTAIDVDTQVDFAIVEFLQRKYGYVAQAYN